MRNSTVRLAGSLLLVPAFVLLASSGSANDAASGEAVKSQWTVPVAPSPSPGTPTGTPEGDYADRERQRMEEERRRGVLGQACRKIKLRKNFNIGSGKWPVTTLGFNRRMEFDIDGRLALVDEETLRATWTRPLASQQGEGSLGGLGASLWAGATVEGKSIVVRRLGTFNSCDEVDRLIDLTDIKLALPLEARSEGPLVGIDKAELKKRIMEMERGELWRIPLSLNVGYGATLSDAANGIVLSLGVGKSKNGSASTAVWRASEKETRFKFLIDYVDVRSASLGVVATIPAVEFGATGGNVLMKFIDREIAHKLSRYTAAYLSMSAVKSNGRRLVLEFVIDPRDPEKAEALAEALSGNFKTLVELAKRMATTSTTPEETREAYLGLEEDNALNLGAPSYASTSEYRGRSKAIALNVPFFVNRTVAESFGSDKVVGRVGEGGEFQFHNAAHTSNAEYFNVPYMGPISKDYEGRNLEVVPYTPPGKPAEAPFGGYLYNKGFLRLTDSAVREGIEGMNAVLRLAGAARRGGPDRTMEIPVPPPPAPLPEGVQEPSNQKGWISMTLVINERAIAAAVSATKDELLKAFAAGTPRADRAMAEWLVKNGRLEGERLVYDQARAARELSLEADDTAQGWLAGMSRKMAGMVADLAEASSASTYPELSEKLAKAFSDESRSGQSHAEMFRVLIQFVDPMDIRGHFLAAVEGGKGEVTIKSQYELTQGRVEARRVREAGEVRRLFNGGSILNY
ncbi:MAG: hypothetical protein HY403_07365 [Elusimicrobia bacterium]|nr:hypothetical protein [Elusimicrobiota bacterium]